MRLRVGPGAAEALAFPDPSIVHIAERQREEQTLKTRAIIARELPCAVVGVERLAASVERLLVVLDRRGL
jgi:hypothetical protein